MIAGVFMPKKLVATNIANCARLAAISGGGTVAANADSNADAAALAWVAACSACVAAVPIHATYVAAAAAIDADAGPRQLPSVSPDMTEE